jgi:hypothetical protein|tara:strand:- start:9794 stop:9985 length:192 start_codon:yes stop_codon:yes gene_type:complete
MGKLPVIIIDSVKNEPNISIGSLYDMDIIGQLEFLTKTICKLQTIRTNKGKQLQKYVEQHRFE